jgi:hypothetical protein
MEYADMDGAQGYIDENGNIVYMDGEMMGSDEEEGMLHHEGHDDGDSYGQEGSPGYADNDDHYGGDVSI